MNQVKKVVFLDRDGVINKNPPDGNYIKNWLEFQFLPGAIQALSLLKKNGYRVFVITNQRGIARGLMTKKDLNKIHQSMQKGLKRHQAQVDGIFYCSHGFNECNCRKPKPGLFFKAAKKHHLNLTEAVFIGDLETDQKAGEAAGCKTIIMPTDGSLLKVVKSIIKDSE